MNYISCKPIRNDFFALTWYVGSECNFNCYYCIPKFNDGKNPFPDFEKFIELADRIKNRWNKEILITLYGGEVTLWNRFPEFLDFCKDRGYMVRLFTNGSKSISWWEKIVDKITFVTFSYHINNVKHKHAIEFSKLINKKGNVHLMLDPKRFNECINRGKDIYRKAAIYVIPKALRVNFSDVLYDYTYNQMKFIRKNVKFGKELSASGKIFGYESIDMKKRDGTIDKFSNVRHIRLNELNYFKGWRCWGGLESLFVDYDGEIYMGQCRAGSIGNIYKEYKLPEKYFICDKIKCNCTKDLWECQKEISQWNLRK